MDTRDSVTNSKQSGSCSRVGESSDYHVICTVYVYTSHVTMDLIHNYVIMCLRNHVIIKIRGVPICTSDDVQITDLILG